MKTSEKVKEDKLKEKEKDRDAIASWSGFNYQGKMTLLYILEYINNLIEEKIDSLADYTFEIEKHEDLVIYKEDIVKVICQMKARLSVSKSYSPHKKACEQLEETIKVLDGDKEEVELILMSALEIDNWEDVNNPFRNKITRYMYSDNGQSIQIGVVEVPDYIKKEINRWSRLRKGKYEINPLDKDYLNDLYYLLCDFLDRKVAEIHKKGKNTDYKISLSKIDELLGGRIDEVKITKEMKDKERLYSHWAEIFEKAIQDVCEECKDNSVDIKFCRDNCGVNIYFEHLEKLKLDNHLRIINPNLKWKDILNNLSVGNNNPEYTEKILMVYKDSEVSFIKDDIELSKTLQTLGIDNIFEEPGLKKFNYIIPTLLYNPASKAKENRVNKNIQRILEEIRNNTEIYPYIDKNILLGDIKGKKLFSLNELITYFPDLDDATGDSLYMDEMNIALIENDYYWENMKEGEE